MCLSVSSLNLYRALLLIFTWLVTMDGKVVVRPFDKI